MRQREIENNKPRAKREEQMRLPFGRRAKGDLSEWMYRHRVGLLVTVVIYLAAIILFLTYRIVVNPGAESLISMEFQQEDQQVVPDQVEQPKQIEQIEMDRDFKLENRKSDANAKLDASIKDNKKTNAGKIYEEAERVAAQMAAGREAYQRSLNEIEATGKSEKTTSRNKSNKDESEAKTAKYNGTVSVEWSLENRTPVYLHVPAYQCQNAGQVVVSITVNRNGRVVQASVDKSTSTNDPCIMDMAIKAAQASSFNASINAPERQRGTITYTFKAQ